MTKDRFIHGFGIVTIIGAAVTLVYFIAALTDMAFRLSSWAPYMLALGYLLVIAGVGGVLLAQRSWLGRISAGFAALFLLGEVIFITLQVSYLWHDPSALGMITLITPNAAAVLFLISMIIAGIVTLEQRLLGKLSVAPLLVGILVPIIQSFNFIVVLSSLFLGRFGGPSQAQSEHVFTGTSYVIQETIIALVWTMLGVGLINYRSAPQLAPQHGA